MGSSNEQADYQLYGSLVSRGGIIMLISVTFVGGSYFLC
jgi:hypothetical protein